MEFDILDRRPLYWKIQRDEIENVENPPRFSTDFDTDEGYFSEENGTKQCYVENGALVVPSGEDGALTMMHVFEKNVSMNVRFMYRDSDIEKHPQLTFILRYNCPEAYVKVKYLPNPKLWCLYSSIGIDFPAIKYIEKQGFECEENVWHDMTFTLDGSTATLNVNGNPVFVIDKVEHLSPGRVAFSSKCTTFMIDRLELDMLSGEGTIWKNVVHNKLPDDRYREGGTVIEMTDGNLTYIHGSGATFTSDKHGTVWDRAAEPWTVTYGYPNILRLANGELLKIGNREVDGKKYKCSMNSSDDGKTWVDGGIICETPYNSERGPTTAYAGNMNDKIMQFKNGRVYYSQNFDAYADNEMAYGLYWVFCGFYYSDDNGKTWNKARSMSWDISGDIPRFGECKVLECADGTIRMYNSWNQLGCVVYSESHDGGVTWGPMVKLPELACASSSMQFVKDTYADNDYTYYMVWVHNKPRPPYTGALPRNRLALAKTTDGKNWKYLGDIWRWECEYACGWDIAHIVDAFIKTTEDYIICGAGFSERIQRKECGDSAHQGQRQHIFSIRKDTLPEGGPIPPAR